jgi:hypothetical protein
LDIINSGSGRAKRQARLLSDPTNSTPYATFKSISAIRGPRARYQILSLPILQRAPQTIAANDLAPANFERLGVATAIVPA